MLRCMLGSVKGVKEWVACLVDLFRLNKSTRQATDGGTTSAQLATNEVKNKGHIVIPAHKVFVKASKRSVVGMAFKPTQRWQNH